MSIQILLKNILIFFDDVIVPFLIALAFLFFIWNVARYFIIGGANSEDQEKAKSLALWGIVAFVVIISILGIVNLLSSSLGFNNTPILPDYIQMRENQKWDMFRM
jgi:hypothetical protein